MVSDNKKANDKAWRERNKSVIAEKSKAKRKANLLLPGFKEKEYERTKKWHAANPDKAWLAACKTRAKKLGVDFDEDTSDIVIPSFCPILGIPLSRGKGFGPTPNSPSLDRIIPDLGYVKGNRWVISHRANTIKNDSTYDELILVGKWAEMQKEL